MLELLLIGLATYKMNTRTPKRRDKDQEEEFQYFKIAEDSSDEEGTKDTDKLIPDPRKISRGRMQAALFVAVLCVAGISAAGLFSATASATAKQPVVSQAYRPSVLGNYSKAAVSIDGEPCAKIGTDVLKEGGTAVDSAIASMFCNGVYNSQSMGIGGGFLMTIYSAKDGKAYTLDAREKAPGAAHVNMFKGDSKASQRGALSVAVPGEIAGYWEAKQRFGSPSMSWMRLVEPTVRMCREGIEVSWTIAEKLRDSSVTPLPEDMQAVFHDPSTGEPWVEGDVYFRNDLADTLEELAKAGDEGMDRLGFYSGQIGQHIVEDLQELGGIITQEDMDSYTADWVDPVNVHLENLGMQLYSVPSPGSGAILAYILNILDSFNIKPEDDNPLLYHRITEAFKWAFALRTELGDPNDPEINAFVTQLMSNMTSEHWAENKFNKINDQKTENNASYYGAVFYAPENHGTAHVSVLAENGDAVSATSTINLYFGSLVLSPRTGILLNDEMDDFSAPNITNYFGVPPSPNNFIRGGKRPLSSMCPAIVVDAAGRVKMVVGAAGGTKITTATALTIIRNLWLNEDIKTSIDARRIHHQLAPMQVSYEPEFSQDILLDLEGRGHRITLVDAFGSVVNGIVVEEDGRVYANADFRKAGAVDGY